MKPLGVEINDTMAPRLVEPPATLEVELDDLRLRPVPRCRSTPVARRNGVGIYKGVLCERGDSSPLSRAPFTPIPSVRRFVARLVAMAGALRGPGIHPADATHAALQSYNLAKSGRFIVIPPALFHMRWKGELHPPETMMYHFPPHRYECLISKPLYGGRDPPPRWFLELS